MTITWENLNLKQFTKKPVVYNMNKNVHYAPRVNVKVNRLRTQPLLVADKSDEMRGGDQMRDGRIRRPLYSSLDCNRTRKARNSPSSKTAQVYTPPPVTDSRD